MSIKHSGKSELAVLDFASSLHKEAGDDKIYQHWSSEKHLNNAFRFFIYIIKIISFAVFSTFIAFFKVGVLPISFSK